MLIAPNHFLLLVPRNVFQEHPHPYFPRDEKEASQLCSSLDCVFWPFLKGATYAFLQSLGSSPDIQDVSKMMGRNLTVTLASPINILRHSPFGHMDLCDSSSLNNPQLNPSSTAGKLLSSNPATKHRGLGDLVGKDSLRKREHCVPQPYPCPLSLNHIQKEAHILLVQLFTTNILEETLLAALNLRCKCHL